MKRLAAAFGLWLASVGASVPAPVNDALILSDTLPATLSEFRLLAGRYGEAVAREKIEILTEMFEEFLPRGLKSRPSPLNPNKND